MKNILLNRCPNNPQKCTEPTKDKRISLEENSTNFIIKNQKLASIYKVQMDGCLVKGEGIKKCDFIINKKGSKKILLIELKSSYLEKAPEQLESSRNYLSQYLPNGYKYKYILVHYGGHTTDLQNIKIEHPYIRIYRSETKKSIEELENLVL